MLDLTRFVRSWRRRVQALLIATTLGLPLPAFDADVLATLYKNPDCGCCNDYADYLRARGIAVKVIATNDLPRVQRENRVSDALTGCHTTRIGRYVFEGHIPIESIRRVLAEQPAIRGLSVPGMPAGSPGMGGKKQGPLNVYTIEDGGRSLIYATY